VVVIATNGTVPATHVLTLAVDEKPAISVSEDTVVVTVGSHMAPITVKVTGYPAPKLALTGNLPNGVSFTAATVLSGTPSTTGRDVVTVSATNGTVLATQSITLVVTAPAAPGGGGGGGGPSSSGGSPQSPTGGGSTPSPGVGSTPKPNPSPPTFVSPTGPISLPVGTFELGHIGSYQIPVSSVTSCEVVHGELPPGLHLSEACLVSGSPKKAGRYVFAARAANTAGSVTRAFVVEVDLPPAPAYRFFGNLAGAAQFRFASNVSPKAVVLLVSHGTLETLRLGFGYSSKIGDGRVGLILQRHGSAYVGRLVVFEPRSKRGLVLTDFRGISVHGTLVHVDAFGTVVEKAGKRQVRRPVAFALSLLGR
jgi:hypothetical protein